MCGPRDRTQLLVPVAGALRRSKLVVTSVLDLERTACSKGLQTDAVFVLMHERQDRSLSGAGALARIIHQG